MGSLLLYIGRNNIETTQLGHLTTLLFALCALSSYYVYNFTNNISTVSEEAYQEFEILHQKYELAATYKQDMEREALKVGAIIILLNYM